MNDWQPRAQRSGGRDALLSSTNDMEHEEQVSAAIGQPCCSRPIRSAGSSSTGAHLGAPSAVAGVVCGADDAATHLPGLSNDHDMEVGEGWKIGAGGAGGAGGGCFTSSPKQFFKQIGRVI